MKLIGSLTSPYVRKVRVVLAEKKLTCELLLEDVWSDQTKIAQSNPLGKVPCLILEGGETMFDSRVIVEYLETISPVGKLLPAQGRERAAVKTWEALADGLCDAAILLRLEKTWLGRKNSERSQAWIDRQMDKINACIKTMEQGLGEHAFYFGAHLSLADIAVGCALGYLDFRFPELNWRDAYQKLAKLHTQLLQRDSFRSTVPGQ